MRESARLSRDDLPDATMRALIDEQFPWLNSRELGRRYTLADHMTVRIGDDYGAIFPRYRYYDPLYARVTDLIRQPSRNWTFPASFPIAAGVPGHGYPYHWVIVDWFSASTSGMVPLVAQSAASFGAAVRQIHVPSPADAPVNPLAGAGLGALWDEFELALAHAGKAGAAGTAGVAGAGQGWVVDASAVRDLFLAGAAQDVDVPRTWTHGRLEPRAVLSERGMFAGIGLWHNFGAGDPAMDLGIGANLLAREMRDDFWAGYGGVSEPAAARAMAYQLYGALRFIEAEEPFLTRIAWDRLSELGLVRPA